MDQLTALLVEDDRLQATTTAALLTHAGFRVTVTTNGADAIEALTGAPYSLCVVDLHLPDIQGASLIQMLRTGPHGTMTKIIAVTASNEPHELEMAFHSGADDVYQKSVGPTVLAAKFTSSAAKFLAEARVACRLQNLEDRMVAHVDELEVCAADKDAKIAAITEVLTRIDSRTRETAEIVVAWNQTKDMVKSIRAAAGFMRMTWPVWALGIAIVVWLKTGKWEWPQ